MYPKNAASPPEIDLGQVLLIADGTIQTTGVNARVKIGSGAWGTAAGSLNYDSTSGIWTYAPTQGETNADYFIVAIYKASCIALSKTIITTASNVAGYAGLDWSKVNAPTTTQVLSGTTISTAQAVASVSGAVGSVTGNVGGNVVGSVASVSGSVTLAASQPNYAPAKANDAMTLTSGERNTLTAQIEAEILNDATGGAVITTIANAVAAYFDNAGVDIPPQVIATAVRNNLATELANINTLITRIVGTLASGTHTPQSGDTYARLGSPTGSSIAADIQTRLASDAYTTPLDSTATQAAAAAALNAYDPPTNAEMEARTLLSGSYSTAVELAKTFKTGEAQRHTKVSDNGTNEVTVTVVRV